MDKNSKAAAANGVQIEEESFFASKVESFWGRVFKRFRKHKLAIAGCVILSILVLACAFAPLVAPYPPEEMHLEAIVTGNPLPPGSTYLWGTDNLGRDYFSRCVYGGRNSLIIGFGATAIALLIGIPLGCVAGYYGGVLDMVIMRVIDVLNCVPSFFLLLITASLVKSQSITGVVFVLGVFGWMGITRQLRAQFLSLRDQEFVQAAVALGLTDRVITFRHLLPNAMMPVVVSTTMSIASNIIAESGLSYLGLGVQEPAASWGSMLKLSQPYLRSAPWMAIFPGLLISIIALSLNFMGDGLRDALDPRTVR